MEEGIVNRVGVIIVAGGSGKRMNNSTPKQFMILGQEPILVRTINRFAQSLPSSQIVLVLASDYIDYWNNLSARFECAKHMVVAGGKERFHSVKSGIEAISGTVDTIAIHAGVRAFISDELIKRTLECAISNGSAIPVIKVKESFRVVDGDSSRVIDRDSLRVVQTPQLFDATIIRRAYRC